MRLVRAVMNVVESGDTHTALAHLVAEMGQVVLPEKFTDDILTDNVRVSVDNARYWQPPDEEERVFQYLQVRAALLPIAQVVAASPATAWWTQEFTGDDQIWVGRGRTWDTLPERPKHLGADPTRLEQWRRHVEEEELSPEPFSGQWWSVPTGGSTATSRAHRGATGLWWEEDTFGYQCAELINVTVGPDARVFTISGESSWAELCRDYPLDVTADKQYDWQAVTGLRRPWVMPDWSRMIRDFDAVHLTVAGYLGTAGRAIRIGERSVSVLAGWAPGETYWLNNEAELGSTITRWEQRRTPEYRTEWHQLGF